MTLDGTLRGTCSDIVQGPFAHLPIPAAAQSLSRAPLAPTVPLQIVCSLPLEHHARGRADNSSAPQRPRHRPLCSQIFSSLRFPSSYPPLISAVVRGRAPFSAL